jgi:preprotein translocase subunit SecG
MSVLIIIIHLIVCFALIAIVLLQTGKGADMGAVFGGAGNQTLFGNTGATSFLGKATTVAAVVFMLTSLSLAYISKSGDESVVSDIKPAAEETGKKTHTRTIPVQKGPGNTAAPGQPGKAPSETEAKAPEAAGQQTGEESSEGAK